MSILDANKFRPLSGGPSFPLRHRFYRAFWQLTWLLAARWTPPPLHRWRVLIIRIFGGKVSWKARIYGSVEIWYPRNLIVLDNVTIGPGVKCYCMETLFIGERSIISQGAHLCGGSHDISSRAFQLVANKITIGQDCWIAADAFVGPGSVIRDGSVLGARAVLFGESQEWGVYTGNPAKLIKFREHTR